MERFFRAEFEIKVATTFVDYCRDSGKEKISRTPIEEMMTDIVRQ